HSGDGYGETATTTIDHSGGGGYDCLTLGAIIFSTAVADNDHDGIPDALESPRATAGLPPKDPNGQTPPHLRAMGATTTNNQKDMFVEVQGMVAPQGTTYGSYTPGCSGLTDKTCAPYNATASPLIGSVTDPNGHTHIPTADVLNLVANTYANAP